VHSALPGAATRTSPSTHSSVESNLSFSLGVSGRSSTTDVPVGESATVSSCESVLQQSV
jgi:hypothetical protein